MDYDYDDDQDRRESSFDREIEQYQHERDREEDSDPCNKPKSIKTLYTTKGKKRRRNAKAPALSSTAYAHEKVTFAQLLDTAISAIGRDSQTMDFKIVGGRLRTSHFSVIYSIPGRSPLKNMQLTTAAHYKELVDEAETKGKPECKLHITEIERTTAVAAEDEDDREGASKKAKKRSLTADEEAMAETIIQLKAAHQCSDRSCTSRICFVGNSTAEHVPMTPLHLSTWSAAMLAEAPGVDIKTPPGPDKEKMFWPVEGSRKDSDDISLLASCRLSSLNKQPPSSSVSITNDFSGFPALLQPLFAQSASTPLAQVAPAPLTPSHTARTVTPVSPIKPAKMTIHEFCAAFQLNSDIADSLAPIKLAGPHHLAFLENEILDKYLLIGQRVAVRYAEGEWKKGLIGL
ncbi:hypothetical protein B0H15DRAFT_944138 [Mycena belliarum]|uniref:Uncharacterized protein n=1 Tax=Mycena belliarum TaxID=1033014 RepID=A0AAD6Y0F4_9AGAR|nr:hypothetical protein B0H15DRAFT_944138 [Mycena belliae]